MPVVYVRTRGHFSMLWVALPLDKETVGHLEAQLTGVIGKQPKPVSVETCGIIRTEGLIIEARVRGYFSLPSSTVLNDGTDIYETDYFVSETLYPADPDRLDGRESFLATVTSIDGYLCIKGVADGERYVTEDIAIAGLFDETEYVTF